MLNTMETIIGVKHGYKQSRKRQHWIVSNKKLELPLIHTPNVCPTSFFFPIIRRRVKEKKAYRG